MIRRCSFEKRAFRSTQRFLQHLCKPEAGSFQLTIYNWHCHVSCTEYYTQRTILIRLFWPDFCELSDAFHDG